MIEFITGKIGGGKTLLALNMMLDDFEKGHRVETNIELNLDVISKHLWTKKGLRFYSDQYRFHDFEENPDFHNHIHRGSREHTVKIYIDEAQLYYNANDSRELIKHAKQLISFHTQSRKFGVDIRFITQDEGTVFSQLRKQALWKYECRDLRGVNLGWLMGSAPMLGLRWKKIDLGGSNQVLEKGKTKLDPNIFNMYETSQCYDALAQSLMETMPQFLPRKNKDRKISLFEKLFRKPQPLKINNSL